MKVGLEIVCISWVYVRENGMKMVYYGDIYRVGILGWGKNGFQTPKNRIVVEIGIIFLFQHWVRRGCVC